MLQTAKGELTDLQVSIDVAKSATFCTTMLIRQGLWHFFKKMADFDTSNY